MSEIHPSSVVSPSAQLGSNVSIGPFVIIESDVQIGNDCCLEGRVVVKRGTVLGSNNYIAEGAVLGGMPQHKQAPKAPGRLVIGDDNTIRENVTIHRGLGAEDETRLGDRNLVMVGVHIAHDCRVGNDTILANNVMLAGHVTVGDRAYLSGGAAAHQYCRIGHFAMVGGQAHVTKDVAPFVTVDGLSSLVVGLNTVGLRRAGVDPETMQQLKAAYRLAFRSGLRWDDRLNRLATEFPRGLAADFYQFMVGTKRGCVHERTTPRKATLRIHEEGHPGANTISSIDQNSEIAAGVTDGELRRAS